MLWLMDVQWFLIWAVSYNVKPRMRDSDAHIGSVAFTYSATACLTRTTS